MPAFSTLVVQRRESSTRRPSIVGLHPVDLSREDQPQVVGAWELLRRIHRGSYADTYLARPAGAAQSCADFVVKLLHEDRADDPVARRLMTHEAAAGRLVQHPHLATVLEAHVRRDPCHLVMPRLEGVTLERLRREGHCAVRRSLRCARQVAEALAELHDHGWRHGDVKPANIVVSPEGHATLIDLSMAAPVSDPLDGAAGSPRYAAPETQTGKAGAASDVYSLGVLLYELLTGEPPVTGDNAEALAAAHRTQTPARLESLAPHAPAGAGQLIRRMLEKSPHDRPFASDVVDQLTPLEIQAFRLVA